MAYELREGQGSLFTNKHKAEGDKKPDRKGDFLLNGVKYEIAGWIKNPGINQFLSLKISPAQEHPRNEQYDSKRPDSQPGDDQRPDGEVPF